MREFRVYDGTKTITVCADSPGEALDALREAQAKGEEAVAAIGSKVARMNRKREGMSKCMLEPSSRELPSWLRNPAEARARGELPLKPPSAPRLPEAS